MEPVCHFHLCNRDESVVRSTPDAPEEVHGTAQKQAIEARRISAAHLQLAFEEEHQAPREGRALAENGQRILSGHVAGIHHHLQHLHTQHHILIQPLLQGAQLASVATSRTRTGDTMCPAVSRPTTKTSMGCCYSHAILA